MNRKKIESTVRSQNLCSPVTRKNKPGAVKKILLSFALLGCVTGASAQEISAAATPSTGDYFGGLTRPLTFDRMIPPYALEVTFNKTTHVIFPSAIRYVDLGSADLLAAKADGTENVLRVKAALRDFSRESNLHTQIKNASNVPFDVDFITFKIADKKVAKRTAIQEQVIRPLRAHNNVQVIRGKSSERMVFTLPKFTIPDDKHLVVELYEKEGGRHQTFTVENADLVHAEVINELKVK